MRESAWRGFSRSDLLERARLRVEEEGVTDDSIELLDEMEEWSARDLYRWLLENDESFAREVEERASHPSGESF